MHRSLAAIVCAILQSQPSMHAEGLARVVQVEASSRHFDPFTLVAMVHYESYWLTGATNGTCMGLGGICLSNYRECSDMTSAGCLRRKACLLDGACNLREAARAITANRVFCRRKTGRARFHQWLASYQGFNGSGVWCGQRLVRGRWRDVARSFITTRVMDRRQELIRKCGRR